MRIVRFIDDKGNICYGHEYSDNMTLLPGTVILTGTPRGVGFVRKPPVYLKPGDTVEMTIDRIGTLISPVV